MTGRATRRALLGTSVAAVGGLAAGSGSAAAPRHYPFHGAHQAGIVTPVQARMYFAAFDLTTERRSELVALLKTWTAAADRMTRGQTATAHGAYGGAVGTAPEDTGEAVGLPASGLTLTFGFGPSLFAKVGLERRRPAALRRLPAFDGDRLEPARSGGELCVQACADDPQVALHAVRMLARLGAGVVRLRWSQEGFGATSMTTRTQQTPRNLFGFKDGTANIQAAETGALRRHVWVDADDDAGAAWLAGGSYLVVRRTEMDVEGWDDQALVEQEAQVGRSKRTGAPLSGGGEFTAPEFEDPGSTSPLIPIHSHLRVMHPDFHDGARMLRRGYSFAEGNDHRGRLTAGLFFLAYVRDPRTHFVPFQRAMARDDAMAQWLTVTGSALFACPPGVRRGEFLGQALFRSTEKR